MGEKFIESTLIHLSLTCLSRIRSDVESTHNETYRLQSLAKFIFSKDMTDIANMNSAMKLSEEAINSIMTVKSMIIIWTRTTGRRGMCSRKTSIRQFGNDSSDFGKLLNPQNLELFPQNLGNLTQNLWKRFPASPKRCLETFSKNRFPESLERFFDDMYHLETIPKTCFENVSKHCFWRLWHLQKRCQTHTQYNLYCLGVFFANCP